MKKKIHNSHFLELPLLNEKYLAVIFVSYASLVEEVKFRQRVKAGSIPPPPMKGAGYSLSV